jgi:hypothetical protein
MAHGARSDWLWFSVWVLLGLAAAAAAISLGALPLLMAAAVAGFLAHRRGIRRSAAGLLGGAGALLLLTAVWTHWHEPTNALNCGEGDMTAPCVLPNHLFEAEMLAVGAALLVSGITLQARRRPRVAVLWFAVLAGLAYAYFAAATYGDSWPIIAVATALAAVAMTAARRVRSR